MHPYNMHVSGRMDYEPSCPLLLCAKFQRDRGEKLRKSREFDQILRFWGSCIHYRSSPILGQV